MLFRWSYDKRMLLNMLRSLGSFINRDGMWYYNYISFGIFIFSLFFSLYTGFIYSIGYPLSLARTFALYPFFLLGYYHDYFYGLFSYKINAGINKKYVLIIICILLFLCEIYLCTPHVFYKSLYYTIPYNFSPFEKNNIITRFIGEISGFLWTGLFLIIIPNKKYKGITTTGQRTFPIYLLHGFIILFIKSYLSLQNLPIIPFIILSLCITSIIIFILRKKIISESFKKI